MVDAKYWESKFEGLDSKHRKGENAKVQRDAWKRVTGAKA
jgi:hypothetical protein